MNSLLKASRISTLFAWFVSLSVLHRVGLQAFREYRQSRLLTILLLWTGLSVFWAVIRSYVPGNFRYMCDYFGLFVATLYLVDRPTRVKALCATLAISMVIVFSQNLDNLTAGSRLVRFRAAYFMGDGNDLAWAFNMLLMAPVFLVLSKNNFVLRLLGAVAGLVGLTTINATQSRGGTLALAAAVLYYWAFLARRKILGVIALVVLATGVIVFAPAGYFSRMQSIQNYEEDGSAQGRMRAWRAAFGMALDYPLGVGAGSFSSAYGRFYKPPNLQGWAVNRWISAHSVYFKVMGEYGFIGLGLLLVIVCGNLLDNQAMLRKIRAHPERYEISEVWPAALNLGMIGYAVSALFLGGITYPHLFLITGLTLGCRRMIEQHATASVAAPIVVAPSWQANVKPVPGTLAVGAVARTKAERVAAARRAIGGHV
jgi:probable O-glycosylation ligase (exosortase A-associated)